MQLVKGVYFPDADSWMADEWRTGRTQFDALDAALVHLTRTRTAVNAGAHVGLFTRQLAEIFDQVYAFEPTLDTYLCLRENMKDCPNVTCLNMALGEFEGTAGIGQDTKHDGNTGGNFIIPGGTECIVKKLDQFELYDVDMLLCDVEGSEYSLLRGATETINRCSPVIVCEEKGRLMERQGVPPDAVRKYLATLGYVQAGRSRRDFIYTRST